jgi:3'-5' exoribonuclease
MASKKGVALVKTKTVNEGKNGPSMFLTLTFRGENKGDPPVDFPARLWENVANADPLIKVGSLVMAEGQVILYNNENQIKLSRIEPLKATEEEIAAFIPRSRIESAPGMARILSYMESLSDPYLRSFGIAIVNDSEVADRFPKAPAAKRNHHALVGGLLEHTLEIMAMGDAVAPILSLNRDLLLLGLFLHDIGKCWEISSSAGFAYTDEGRLVGHMALGVEKCTQVAKRVPDFPERYLRLLHHFILAHHGEFEYGSPVLPATPEAMAVHMLDNLSGQVFAMRQVPANGPDGWGYEKNRGAFIYKEGSDPKKLDPSPMGKGVRKVFDP